MSATPVSLDLKLNKFRTAECIVSGSLSHDNKVEREGAFDDLIKAVRSVARDLFDSAEAYRSHSGFSIKLSCTKEKAREIIHAVVKQLERLGHGPILLKA